MKGYKEGVIVGGNICIALKVYPASINVPALLFLTKCEDLAEFFACGSEVPVVG